MPGGLARLAAVAVLVSAVSGCAYSPHPQATFRSIDRPFAAVPWGCWPLPAPARPPYPVLAQSVAPHGDGASRRLVATFQFFAVDEATARGRLAASLRQAGFRPLPGSAASRLGFRRAGFGTVYATISALADAGPVRGTVALDLPATARPLTTHGTCPRPGHGLGTS